MRRIRSSKRTSAASPSRSFRPRLESLEDRCLLSGSPGAPSVLATITSLANLYPQQEVILPDGKILVGTTVGWNGPDLPMLQNGTPIDPSLVMGQRTQGIESIELLRFNADGSLDDTFGNGGVVLLHPDLSDTFAQFSVQSDGSIVVAGTEVSSPDGYLVQSPYNWPANWPYAGQTGYDFVWQDSGVRVLRLNADGSVDSSFQAGNIPGFRMDTMGADGTVGGVTVQPDGKVIVAGEEEGFGNSTLFVARYNTDGSFDTSFNPGGTQPGVATTPLTNPPIVLDPNYPLTGYAAGYGWVASVAVQGDGKIVVAGNESGYGLVVLRYNADGSADAGFGSDGMASFAPGNDMLGYFNSLVIQPDGKILVAGYGSALPGTISDSPTGGLILVRFDADGSFDPSFGQQGVVYFDTVSAPLGPYTVDRPALPNEYQGLGPVDANFVWDQTTGVVLQADGTIDVAGELYANPNGDFVTQGAIAQFNADGSPDTTFGPSGVLFTTLVANSTTYQSVDPVAISAAPDGSVLILGNLNYGSYLPLPYPGLPQEQLLVDFQGGMTGGPVPPPPPPPSPAPPEPVEPGPILPVRVISPAVRSAPVQTPTSASDAAFQLLASAVPHPGAGSGGGQSTNGLVAAPVASPSVTQALPIPTPSQSEIVARLSGGGDQPVATDSLTQVGEQDRIWDLVAAGPVGDPSATLP